MPLPPHSAVNIFGFHDFNIHHVKWLYQSNTTDGIQTFNFSVKWSTSLFISLIILTKMLPYSACFWLPLLMLVVLCNSVLLANQIIV